MTWRPDRTDGFTGGMGGKRSHSRRRPHPALEGLEGPETLEGTRHGRQPHRCQGPDRTGPAPAHGTGLVQDAVVITLRTDSFECPHCGNIVVATDDLAIDLESEHECPAFRAPAGGAG